MATNKSQYYKAISVLILFYLFLQHLFPSSEKESAHLPVELDMDRRPPEFIISAGDNAEVDDVDKADAVFESCEEFLRSRDGYPKNLKKIHTANMTRPDVKSDQSLPSASNDLPTCPEIPPGLQGNLTVALGTPPTLGELGRTHSDLSLGGHYTPASCKARVAIIVPFRDRDVHLRIFLFNILPLLKRQEIDINVFVVEQADNNSKDEPFNRAMLFNVGFVEANKRRTFDCFIFHDVDLIPENDHNLCYNCPVQPRHMSVAVDKWQYRLPFWTIFGGVSALAKSHFEKINGFSNSYWGWGAEDDDTARRVEFNELCILRRSASVARYKMLKHKKGTINPQGNQILDVAKTRFKTDGLSNLKYKVEQVELKKTFTLIKVRLERPKKVEALELGKVKEVPR